MCYDYSILILWIIEISTDLQHHGSHDTEIIGYHVERVLAEVEMDRLRTLTHLYTQEMIRAEWSTSSDVEDVLARAKKDIGYTLWWPYATFNMKAITPLGVNGDEWYEVIERAMCEMANWLTNKGKKNV